MQVPSIDLNDGRRIPQLGFGTWKIAEQDAPEKVAFAIKTGYRHIDTAKAYYNEQGVGEGLRRSGEERETLFLTDKLWNADQGYDQAIAACEMSLNVLKADYLNLYLIHWPCPKLGKYLASWKALIQLREQGLVRSIGVSNFTIANLEHIIKETGIVPAVNQIELHPHFQQAELRAFHKKHNIATEAYSPLGRGTALQEPVIQKIAAAHGKTAGQIILRWHIELGNIIIPKSNTESRIAENFRLFDFKLTEADKAAIAGLDKKTGRILPNPADFNGLDPS